MTKTTISKTPKASAARPRRTVKKTIVPKTVVKREPKILKTVKRTYIFAVGRRKEAVARVRVHEKAEPKIIVNDRPLEHYFPTQELQKLVREPLVVTQNETLGQITARVAGGGTQGQAEAVRLGITRALVKKDGDLRLVLKRAGFLHRDPRVKERKKYGLKRARRAPQWQKR